MGSRLDIGGHLFFKLALPQLLCVLVTREARALVWMAIVGASVTAMIILGRELEHMLSPPRVRRRRYFLYRLGPTFAKFSLVLGILMHALYLVLALTCITYGLHNIYPTAYQLAIPQAPGTLFAAHFSMNFENLIFHASATALAPQTAGTIFLGMVPKMLCFLLLGIFLAELLKMPKPRKPLVAPQTREAQEIKINLHSEREIEAQTLLLVETMTGKKDVRPEDDLFDDLGIDSLGFIEITFTLEESFGIELPEDDDKEPIRTTKQLSKLVAAQLELKRTAAVQLTYSVAVAA